MITRTIELADATEQRIQLASAAYRMTGTEFVYAAIQAALACSAEEVPAVARAFELAAV